MKLKKVLTLILAIVVIAVSFFYSERIYGFYLSVYYKNIKNFTSDDINQRVKTMFEAGEKDECKLFLRQMLLVYFRDVDMMRTLSRIYLDMGEHEQGAALFLHTLEDNSITLEDANILIPELAKGGYFSDIKALLTDRDFSGRMRGFYGIACYYTGYFKEAVTELKSALREEGDDPTLLYCLAKSYVQLGNTKEAFSCIEKAYQIAPRNKEIKNEFNRLSYSMKSIKK